VCPEYNHCLVRLLAYRAYEILHIFVYKVRIFASDLSWSSLQKAVLTEPFGQLQVQGVQDLKTALAKTEIGCP
jgi:hypothetical protein